MTVTGSRAKRKTAIGRSSTGKSGQGRRDAPPVDASAGVDSDATDGSAALDIVRRARRYTNAALDAFVAVMQDDSAPAAARVAAATQILNWSHGKNAGGESESAPKTVKLAWEA